MKTESAVSHATSATFDSEVLQSPTPVVVDVYASWCGPCRLLAPVLEKLADAYGGRLKFVKVDVDEEPELARRYDVTGVPTLLLFKDGRLEDQVVGLVPPAQLQEKLDALLNPAPRPSERWVWRG
jgi:thioredoxin 1